MTSLPDRAGTNRITGFLNAPAPLTLGDFLGGINWTNTTTQVAAAVHPSQATTLGGFLAAINWANTPTTGIDLFLDPDTDTDHRRGAERTVDAVLSEFVWD